MGQGLSGYKIKTYGGKRYIINEPSGHSVPRKDIPNSVTQTFDKDGNLVKERYYGNDGKADFDIDYTNHGNAHDHPKVPHTHKWDWSDPDNPKRGEAE